MKKYIIICMIITIILTSICYADDTQKIELVIGSKEAKVNGVTKTMDIAPTIDAQSNRTLVPVRFLTENLGFKVIWYKESKVISLYKIEKLELNKTKVTNIVLQLDNPTCAGFGGTFKNIPQLYNASEDEIVTEFELEHINNYKDTKYQLTGILELEQAPKLLDGYTMVPVRILFEEMGYKVDWNKETQVISIYK